MMKKTVCGILLALAALLTAASCSFHNPEADRIPILGESTAGSTPEVPDTEEPRQPSETGLLIGKWYSEPNALVMQFFSDGSLRLYGLAPGYYAYADCANGTYTYDGLTLTYTLENGAAVTAECSVTAAELSMTAFSQTLTFAPAEALPQAHPEYSFPDFEALADSLPRPEGSLTGNTIQTDLRAQALEQIRESYWETHKMPELTEGTAQIGDTVNIDYTGYLDGVEFEGGKATGQTVRVTENSGYIPGFAEGIAGHSVGETFDVPVTFPEDYGEASLAGKAVIFRMTLNCIYDTTLTDDMAADSGYESLDAWIDEIYAGLLADQVWELIPGLAETGIPEEAYRFFYQNSLDNAHAYAFYYFNNQYELFLLYAGLTEEGLLADAVDTARRYLLGVQAAKLLNLTPNEELSASLTEEFIQSYIEAGYTREQAEALLEGEGKAQFRATLLAETAQAYLLANNTFVPTE